MALRWTSTANRDLVRLHAFLEPVDARAAAGAVRRLRAGVKQIARFPRIGVRLSEFSSREVRKLVVGDYEIRYVIQDAEIIVLRSWHVFEDR
jgi:plasmid stabilization system protein ParE